MCAKWPCSSTARFPQVWVQCPKKYTACCKLSWGDWRTMGCQGKTMVSHRLCNHVTCVLDAPLSVLSDSLKFGSNILWNIQLIASYHGETGEQWVAKAKQWCLRVYVTMWHLCYKCPFSSTVKFSQVRVQYIQLIASYCRETGEQWVAKAKQWFLRDYVTM